jgi:hypothetical protein
MAKFAGALLEATRMTSCSRRQDHGEGIARIREDVSEVAAFAYVPVPLPEGLEPG